MACGRWGPPRKGGVVSLYLLLKAQVVDLNWHLCYF